MEIESEDGSRIGLQSGSKTVFGRGSGFDTADHTVSRRHLLFETDRQTGPSPRASFEILGKNPVWVRRGEDHEIRVYRRSDKGELAVGDWFCVAGQRPLWFSLKGIEIEIEDYGSERDSGSYRDLAEGVDVSDIDPVKEFGFLVIGHEFDHYPKQMLRQVKDWNWFLEEPSKNSDDDEEKVRSNKRKKRRRVKGHHEEDNDEEWTGESEDERKDLEKVKKVRKQNYLTRSNDPITGKSSTQKIDSGSSSRKEEDDTLGGFIVKDDEAEPEEQSEVEEEEEEEEEEEDEFIEDDDEDD